MNRQANRLAHYLKGLGVGPETVVGVYLDRSVEKLIAILGVIKAGGAYLPIAITSPTDRVAFVLKDAGVGVVVVEQRLAQKIEGVSARVVCLEKLAGHSEINPAVNLIPSNLAYVIYTSGSTGRPKGVGISHRSAVHLLQTSDPELDFGASDVWSCAHSFSFDLSVWEIWTPLAHGSRLVIVPREVLQSPESFLELIERERVTVLNRTPSGLRPLVDLRRQERNQARNLAVRIIASGGEALPRELAQQLLEWDVPVWNFYGPTETTVWASTQRVREEAGREGVVEIGRALSNTQLLMLDSYMQPVGVGVVGELCIGGEGVGRGYVNRPDLTAEKFIPDPLGQAWGGRCYQTGDLVRYLANEEIEYLGRRDYQAKVRGYRIEPGEIEAVLGAHEGVRQCAVMVKEDEGGDKRLVAYVVNGEGAPSEAELRRYLRGRLPDYMVPAAFMELSELPLTPNGKLDRKALPEPATGEGAEKAARHRTPVEEILSGIFAEILRREKVGVEDNFFELGGHSLLATQVISRVREILQTELPLRALFESPTVAGLAEAVERERSAGRRIDAPAIEVVSRERVLPLSYAQQRLWFIQQLEPESAAYNIPSAVRLIGSINLALLRQSLGEIARRHEVLRTRFESRDGHPVQVIDEPVEMVLPICDISHLAAGDGEQRAGEIARQMAQRPFDLERGPVWKAMLVKLNPQDHLLVINMHHVASDGWSTEVMVKEFTALYEGYQQGRSAVLPELEVQYADFAIWQREWLRGEPLEEQLSYWRRQLAGAPVLELLIDRARPAMTSHRGTKSPFTLSAELSQELKVICRRQGATLFMTLLAAFQTLLHRYTGMTDIVVGTPIANRNRVETEGLIGFFVNMLALRTDLSGKPPFVEVLKRVRGVTLDAFAHQDLPFDKLVEELHPERRLEQTPLFRIALVLQNVPQSSFELPDLTLMPFGSHTQSSLFDLSLYLWEGEEGLKGYFVYDVELFDSEAILRLASQFQILLRGIVAQPDARICDLPLLTEAEKQLLLNPPMRRSPARRRERRTRTADSMI